jgi:hypothetical protein
VSLFVHRKAYLGMGDRHRAARWAERCLKGPIRTLEDREAHACALTSLKDLDPEAFARAVEQGAQDSLDKAHVRTPVEAREDGYAGENIPLSSSEASAPSDAAQSVAAILLGPQRR